MPTPLLLVLTAASFGASPLLIALAVEHLAPATLAGLRAGLGLPFLLVVAALAGQIAWPGRQAAVTAAVGGLLIVAVPFGTMAVGMQHIPSGLGGMLYATMPLFTLILAAAFLRDEPATLAQVARIAVGMLGVGLIAGPQLLSDGLTAAGWGTAVTLIAPLSYAAGNVWFRNRPPVAPLALTAGMFGAGALVLAPLAWWFDGTPPLALGPEVWGILAALVIFATVLPAVLNYTLVRQAGATTGALVMFLMPGFAVAFGMVFAGERLPPLAFAGLALVIAASLRVPMVRRRKPT